MGTGVSVDTINVPVVGGHAGTTILPLFSQCPAAKSIAAEQIPDLDKKVQDAGTAVVAAKNGKGSATLITAFCLCLKCLQRLFAINSILGASVSTMCRSHFSGFSFSSLGDNEK